MEWAFQTYASGALALPDLRDELTTRGLTTLPTPKRPAKPLGLSTLHRILRNPYYIGQVAYKGARYTLIHARSRHGDIYPYFNCPGRHTKRTICTRQAVPVSVAERLVEDHIRHVELTPDAAQALTSMLDDIFDQINQESETERRDLTRQKERLEAEQLKLLQAHYADAISLPVLKKEQDRITGELAKITITERNQVISQLSGVYNALLDLSTRRHAEHWRQTGEHHLDVLEENETTLPNIDGAGLELPTLSGAEGI